MHASFVGGLMHASFVGKVAFMPSKYDEQTKAKAVRLVTEHRGDYTGSRLMRTFVAPP
jgi:hypothetical protein